MEQQPERLNLWWAAPIAVFVVLIVLAMFLTDMSPRKPGSSYDPAPRGYRAFFTLLEEMDYPVKRSRRRVGDESVRWMLTPKLPEGGTETEFKDEFKRLDDWVRQGGRLVLTATSPDFPRALGLTPTFETLSNVEKIRQGTLDGQAIPLKPGKRRVDFAGVTGRTWGSLEGRPLVTIVPRGRGEIWLVHYPDLFTNRWLAQADNAVFVCRLAEASLEDRPGPLVIDEYFHDMRERPGVLELLFKPPVLWVTLQGVGLLGVLLWRNVPRFGPLRLLPPVTRRSKEEFLDAMALLLQRKGDHREAFQSARHTLLVEMAAHLGLPGDSEPEAIAEAAARQRSLDRERLERVLVGAGVPSGGRPRDFVEALRELEAIRNEFFSLPGARGAA